ncbi:MAG: response regulator [Sporomusaceae bacterium]|nr:response regulator [Sporomusaceae bacterium]
MSAIRIMIVDDSPFSRTLLADALQEQGYEVAGEADGFDSLLEVYSQCKPDLVTMDIAMPGSDGFECSKALRLHDPKARIIMVSSMKDEETEAEARRAGVVGYLQKPIDSDTLNRVIGNVMAPDSLFHSLQETGLATFREALSQSVTRMTKTAVTYVDDAPGDAYISQGITAVIGIIGRYSGTTVMDMPTETAAKMAAKILRREPKGHDEVVAMAAEFANVAAGIACSMLNKKEKALGLRVAPPSVFHGKPTEIVSPTVKLTGCYIDTDFGRLYISVGFKKGSVLWM